MSHRLPLALIALIITISVGCREPVGLPKNDVHAAAWQTFYCTPTLLNATGHVDWYQSVYGTTLGPCYWHYGTIKVGFEEDQYGRAWPRCNGVCQFSVPHIDPPEGGFIPVCHCTLYYYQGSHTEQGEGESVLVNSWFLNVQWPPNDDAQAVYWAIWGSTDTVAVDVIHEDDGWCRVPLTDDACRAIADTAFDANSLGVFFTGWVYHGSVDSTYTNIYGEDDVQDRYPYIAVWYNDVEE